MPVQTLVRETLDLWREAERALDCLPDTSADHETVGRVVLELRLTYQRLTTTKHETEALLLSSLDAIDAARQQLREVQTLLDSGLSH
jgi:hypothetical protein